MRRREAVALVLAALAMVATAATWLFGPIGLGAVGLVLLALILFVVDVGG